jgi:hypothetical protein
MSHSEGKMDGSGNTKWHHAAPAITVPPNARRDERSASFSSHSALFDGLPIKNLRNDYNRDHAMLDGSLSSKSKTDASPAADGFRP